jgi:DNA-binding response OmpR family regulator
MLDLRRREALILEALVQRTGRVVTRDVLIEAVYGFDDLIESNTLEAQISRLRRKLKDAGAGVEITSLRGIGYMLRVSEAVC